MFTFFNYLFGTGEKRRKFFWPWRACSIAHWTEPFTNDTLGLCFLDSVPRNRSSVFHAVTFSTSVITAILSPVAVSGNGLIMAAIWRKQSLRTPTYVLLRGLAFIYLCTGLIIQPFFCCRRTYLFRHTTDGKQSTFIPYFCAVITSGCGAYIRLSWPYRSLHWWPLKDDCTWLAELCWLFNASILS